MPVSSFFRCRHIAAISLMLCAAATLAGCGLEAPEAPRFETTLSIPAADEHYDTAQLIDSADYLEDPGNGTPQFVVEGDFGPQSVASALDVSVNAQSWQARLDNIAVANPPDLTTRYGLPQLLDVTVPPGGGSLVIPATDIVPTRQALATIDEFESATLNGGTLHISLQNHLPVSLGGGATPLMVRLFDQTNGRLILSAHSNAALAAGASLDLPVDLAGLTFSSHLEVEVQGSSPGSSNQSVPVHTEDALDIRCGLTNLSYRSATLRPAGQTIQREEEITLDPGVRLDRAAFRGGQLRARLRNTLPLPITVTLTAAELTRLGLPVIETRTLSAGSPASPAELLVTIDLAAAVLESAVPAGSPSVHLQIEGRTETTASEVTLTSDQGVTVDLEASTLELDSVEGTFDGKSITITPTSSTTDLPADIETIRFEHATLTLDLENGAGLSATTDLSLRGERAGQPAVTLPLRGQWIAAAANGAPVTTRIVLNEGNSALLDLLHLYPDQVTLSGQVTLGDGGTTGSLHRTDTVRGHYRLTAPLRMRFDSVEHVTDPFDFTVDSSAQKAIRDHVTAAEVELRLVNRFPVAVTAVIQFGADAAAAGAHPEVVLAAVTVNAAPVDASGRAIDGVTQTVTLTVPADKISFFARDRVWGAAKLTLNPAVAGQAIEIQSTDFIDVQALARFRYRVKA